MTPYELDELKRFNREIVEIERAPLDDRRSGKDDLDADIRSGIDHFITQADWIINGTYGAGAMIAYKQLTKRMNRRAWLFNVYAQLNHRTSYKYAAQVYHALPNTVKTELNRQLDILIAEHDAK